MPRWAASAVKRIRRLAVLGRVRLTHKARLELAELALGLGASDVPALLAGLDTGNAASRYRSSLTGEWLHVFRPVVAGVRLYIKVVLRHHCVVVSFHEDESTRGEP